LCKDILVSKKTKTKKKIILLTV